MDDGGKREKKDLKATDGENFLRVNLWAANCLLEYDLSHTHKKRKLLDISYNERITVFALGIIQEMIMKAQESF